MSHDYNIYNKMNVLCYDIENVLDREYPANQHIIKKIFYYFNRSCIDGKYVKPYLIRIFLSSPEEKEVQWGINELYQHFKKIPKYQLQTNVLADYNYIDINNKQFTIRNQETIDKFSNFEEEAYEFEVNKGNVIMNEEKINQLYELIESYGIEYDVEYDKPEISMSVSTNNSNNRPETVNTPETDTLSSNANNNKPETLSTVDNNNPPASIILYPSTANYQIRISLNGKIGKMNAYDISPNVKLFKQYPSLGKFNKFAGKSTQIPNDDNLALIHKCNYCNKPMIYNWWVYTGTRCPYCQKLCKISI